MSLAEVFGREYFGGKMSKIRIVRQGRVLWRLSLWRKTLLTLAEAGARTCSSLVSRSIILNVNNICKRSWIRRLRESCHRGKSFCFVVVAQSMPDDQRKRRIVVVVIRASKWSLG